MLLLNHGDSAAATGDNYLICGCQRTDGFDLYDVDRLGGSNDTAEALAGIFLDIIALLYFNLSIFLGHVTTDDLGGLIESLIIRIYRDLGEDGAIFVPYSQEQRAAIDGMLQRLMDETYDGEGGLKPTIELDMSWLDKTVCKWVKEKGREATLSGSQSLDVFRKRSSVSAFRVAALCYHLYAIGNQVAQTGSPAAFKATDASAFPTTTASSCVGGPISEEVIQKRCRQIYLYMAEYILTGMMERWGKRFEDLNLKREQEQKAGPKESLFDMLTETFTREQLNLLIEKQGKATPDKVFLSRWKKLKVIEMIDKNTFRKINIRPAGLPINN